MNDSERSEIASLVRQELQSFAQRLELPRMLTPEDVAAWLGVKLETVHTYVSRESLPHLKIGPKLLRFEPDHVLHWARSRGRNLPELPAPEKPRHLYAVKG